MTYEDKVLQLANNAARGLYDSTELGNQIFRLADSTSDKSTYHVIQDMFSAYAEQMADDIVASRMKLLLPTNEELKDTVNAVKEITGEDPERDAVFRRMRYEQEYKRLYGSN